MTITDTPSPKAESDETQVLFWEARQRRRRRRISGGTVAAFTIVIGIVAGLTVLNTSSGPTPLATTRTRFPSGPAAAPAPTFSIRPVECYAGVYSPTVGQIRPTGPLPTCSATYQLSAANLQVEPQSNNGNGYIVNTNIGADPQFANYSSTSSSGSSQNQDVLLPGSTGSGPSTRYVLGPAGLGLDAIAHAKVTKNSGEWAIDLVLTSKGAEQWDAFAAHTFHEISGVVVNGHVLSAPIMQPTQSSFTSFDGQIQIAGGFTEHQAKVIASEL